MLTAMGDVMREAYRRGWITTRDGNVSVYDKDRGKEGRFYVTPSAVRKNKIEVEHIAKYNVRGGTPDMIGGLDPSIEFDMHWNIHRDRGFKIGAVVHLHPTNCVAAMHKGIELADLERQFPELGRYTKVGFNVLKHDPGSDLLAKDTAENMIGYDIVGQIGHGVTAYAQNPWDAFEHIERLEHICEIVLKSGI